MSDLESLNKLPPREKLLNAYAHFESNFYGPELFKRHAQALQLMQQAGISPQQNTAIYNPYKKEHDHRDFRNVGEHSVAVAFCAHSIAELLYQRKIISEETLKRCEERALLHDLGKRFEVFRRESLGNARPLLAQGFAAELGSLAKIDKTLSKALADYGSETGAESAAQFWRFTNKLELNPLTPIELQIVRLADNMTASTLPSPEQPARNFFVTFLERAVICDFKVRYPEFFEAALVLNADSKIEWIRQSITLAQGAQLLGTLLSMECLLCRLICKKICSLLELQTSCDPQEVIRDLINIKLANFQAKLQNKA